MVAVLVDQDCDLLQLNLKLSPQSLYSNVDTDKTHACRWLILRCQMVLRLAKRIRESEEGKEREMLAVKLCKDQ